MTSDHAGAADSEDRAAARLRPGQIAATAFISPTAVVRGDVTIGEDSSVWFGAVLRGDSEAILIGRRSNIQDGCVLHADPGIPCTIGDDVTIGHAAVVHGATVESGAMVGIGAIVLNRCRVGAGSIVAAGALLTEGTEVPPGSVVMGTPGKVRRPADADDAERIRRAAQHYVELARRYRAEEG